MARKKRHHYLPVFYLNGFVDPHNKPYIWIYEKGNLDVRKASAKDIAAQKHYYSFTTPEGERDSETFENVLEKIEGKVAPIINNIKEHKAFTDEQRGWFALFLAFTMTRVPSCRENNEQVTGEAVKKANQIWASYSAGFKSMVEKFEKDTGNKIEMSVEKLRKFVLEGQYDVKIDSQFSLAMILTAIDLAPIFYGMNWTFLEATEDYKFVTSDNPLSCFDPTYDPKSFDMGLLNRNIEITFPISKDLMFLGTWKQSEGYKKLNNKLVKDMNHRTVISALRFVFASEHSDTLNRFVQKYKDRAPRIEVDNIGNYIIAHYKPYEKGKYDMHPMNLKKHK